MLHIDKSTKLTIKDFLANKDVEPFKSWRRVAKTENFGLMFGCSAIAFASMLKAAKFTENDCDDFLALTHKTSEVNKLVNNNSRFKMSILDAKYFITADTMRTAFFNSYKGLEERIKREQKFAVDHGYVRSWHGPVRHLPELKFMKVNKEKMSLDGYEKANFSKLFSHLLNNACNSAIQSMESRIAFSTWTNISKYLRAWNLKSYCWNNVHDSLDFYVYKPELELVMALSSACASWLREPVKGIEMSFDAEVSDLLDRDKTYYKHGIEVKALPIEEALSKYNKKNNTDLKWYGCEWQYDTYDKKRDEYYKKYCDLYGKETTDEFLRKFNED